MDVIVIGGGIGGLSAAISLAAGGAHVTLLEKNERVGGKLNIWQQDGFTFDTGPHVLTMPWALEEVYTAAGRNLADEVEMVRLDILCRYHFTHKSTTYLDASANQQEAARIIDQFSPGASDGFRRLLAYARKVSEATTGPFLKQDFGASIHGIPSPTQWQQLGQFLALKPWRSLRDVVRECFTDGRLRQIFEMYALYSGSHPARCSGIFATVADVQWRQGTFYVPGGLYCLAESLYRIAKDLGINIDISIPVSEVIVKAGRAQGVVTAHGERLFADAVVCNADCLAAMKSFIPAACRRHYSDRRIAAIEPSTSAFLLLLGISGSYPQLAHHNSFLADDPEAEFDSIFDRQLPALDPTIGVTCQSVSDPTRAPAGCSNLFVMTNPPALSERFDWRTRANDYRERVLVKLESLGLTDLRCRIRVEQMWTPLDLQARYGAHRGAIYGLSSNGWRNAFLRPPQVSPDVQGLYFVGGSTHPGGGLPLCALSGTNVARCILGS